MHSTIVKKTVIILLVLALAGCSAIPLDFFTVPPTPTMAPTETARPTVTIIPTRDLFAINTQGPTDIPPTFDPNFTPPPASRTPTLTRTPRSTITLDTIDPSLYTPSPNIIQFVQRSTDQLVWGYNCEGDRSILFTATVNQVKRLKYVLLFVRLQDKYSGRGTNWGAGAIMKDNDRGVYFYKLELDQISDYDNFQDAWLQYQIVASTIGLTVLGRSVVDRTSVSLTHCSAMP